MRKKTKHLLTLRSRLGKPKARAAILFALIKLLAFLIETIVSYLGRS